MAKKEKPAKPAKPAKAKAKKKPQLTTEQGGIGRFFQLHGEKIGFGVILLASVALIYLGWTASTTLAPDTNQVSPAKIMDLAKRAKSNIERTDPAEVVKAPPPLAAQVGDVKYDGYVKLESVVPSPKPTPRSAKLRKDPTLFPPIKPEVTSVTGPFSVKKTNPDKMDRLSLVKNWVDKQSNESGGGPTGPTGPGAGPRRGGGGAGPAGAPGGAGPAAPGGAGPAGGGGMFGGAGAGNLLGLLDDGHIPVSVGDVEAQTGHVIIVKMLVPNELQVQEYKDKFDGTDELSTPAPLGFQVERAVLNGPNDKDYKWELVDSSLDLDPANLIKDYGWENIGPLVADPSVYHPSLTMAMPPIIARKFEEISLHSETPPGTPIYADPDTTKDEPNDEGNSGRKRGEFRFDPNTAGGAGNIGGRNPYGRGGMPGMPGAPGGGMPGMPGAPGGGMPGRPGGGAPGMPGPGGPDGGGIRPGRPGGGMPGSPGAPGGGMPGMPGGGMPGGGGMFGGGSGSSLSKYFLLRYCDVNVEPGKYYRYRVRVIYEDPNKPFIESFATRPSALDDTVLERLHKEALEREKSGEKGTEHLRFTEWSEPSPVAKVSSGHYAFAGPPSKGYASAALRLPGTRVRFFGNEPSVQMFPVVYNPAYAVDVYPNEPVDAVRGAVLNVDANAAAKRKVIHPISREAKELEPSEYSGITGITVVDIFGGETVATRTSETDAVYAPVEVMLVDDSGQVIIRGDIKDEADFYKFVPREEPKSRSEGGEGGGAPGTPGGGPGRPGGAGPGGSPGPAGGPGRPGGSPRGGR